MKIKCGICIAYDWELLKYSLPLVYPYVHSICLALDEQRISWSGKKFEFDDTSFYSLVRELDTDNKVTILEDTFFLAHLTPPENEVRQRKIMAENMGLDGWHMQLDVDEYLLDAENLKEILKAFPENSPSINLCAQWITLFKRTKEGFLVIHNSREKREFVPLLTNAPLYTYGRQSGSRNIYTNILLLHQSWAREPEEIQQKLRSWGHAHDFDADRFYSFWHSLDEDNFSSVRNFHPLVPTKWQFLILIRSKELAQLFETKVWEKYRLSQMYLLLKNSKVLAKIRFLLDRIK